MAKYFTHDTGKAATGNIDSIGDKVTGISQYDIFDLRPSSSEKKAGLAQGKYYDSLIAPYEYYITGNDAGGFRQLDSLEISLLAHELTHTVQQLDKNKWGKTKEQNNKFYDDLKRKNTNKEGKLNFDGLKEDEKTYQYGISEKIMAPQEIVKIEDNPSKYIGQENNLQFPKGLGTTDNRADINRYIIAEKMKRMKEMKLINDKN